MPDAGDNESRPVDAPPSGPKQWPAESDQPPAAEAADEGETAPIDPALLQIARQEAARTAAGAADEEETEPEKPKRLGPKPPELRGRPVPPAQPTTALPPAGFPQGPKTPPPMPPPMPSPWARPGSQPPPVPPAQPSTGAPYGQPHPGPGHTGQQPAVPAHPGAGHTAQQPAIPAHPGPGHTGQQPAIPAHPGAGHTGQQPAIPATGAGYGTPPRRRGRVWWIVGAAVAAFLLIAGCAVGATLVVVPSMAGQVIVQGQCVKRTGDRTLVPAGCQTPGALKVLQRIDDTVDGSKCPKQTTTVFTHREDDNTYVLCLGQP